MGEEVHVFGPINTAANVGGWLNTRTAVEAGRESGKKVRHLLKSKALAETPINHFSNLNTSRSDCGRVQHSHSF